MGKNRLVMNGVDIIAYPAGKTELSLSNFT